MRPCLLIATFALTACDTRVLYTVEGTVTSSSDDAALVGIRVDCAIIDDPDSAGEAVTDDVGDYSCSAALDGATAGRGPRTLTVAFVDEDDAQRGSFHGHEEEVTVQPDAAVTLDVALDPAS